MKVLHLTSKDFKTAQWSGGTTTELFLYPENGSYARRDFLFRISSATVDLQESDFTPLPSVDRFITPLDGSFTLTHPGLPPVVLPPLAPPYRFSGETPTHCVGKARDFNLMFKDCSGRMTLEKETATLRRGFNGLYAVDDTRFCVAGQTYTLGKGELLAVFSEAESQAYFDGTALLCWAEI